MQNETCEMEQQCSEFLRGSYNIINDCPCSKNNMQEIVWDNITTTSVSKITSEYTYQQIAEINLKGYRSF